jgi:hypothetical protein
MSSETTASRGGFKRDSLTVLLKLSQSQFCPMFIKQRMAMRYAAQSDLIANRRFHHSNAGNATRAKAVAA